MDTRNEYFDNPAISRGTLLNFKKSARTGSVKVNENFDSKALIFGRAFHCEMEGKFNTEFFWMYNEELSVQYFEKIKQSVNMKLHELEFINDFFPQNL